MRLWWHRLTHWEYWPVYVVYASTFFLWTWWVVRFRSINFFKYVNPAIKNGGLYGDSKFDIYELLPKNSYPKTHLIQHGLAYDFAELLVEGELTFPLIVKPDVGLRGIGVQRVNNIEEIQAYSRTMNENFLIQELIEYPNEMGLFYCRMPNERDGRITGITLKEFLCIEGNGTDCMEDLLRKNPRFEMQIPKLRDKLDLSFVLPENESQCIVPFGNHNRGTEFLDGSEVISEKLESTINDLLAKVDGFYYGRLDIRYNSLEDLENGIHFSIIELNGAKSEPTHIYDPKHSFLYGQKEIIKHQLILKNIVKSVRRKGLFTT
jgi:hypothetical protein